MSSKHRLVGLDELSPEGLPKWALVRQRTDRNEIEDVGASVEAALNTVLDRIPPHSRVCLAVGSRGIDRLADVVRSTVKCLLERSVEVFVVPAMGSHGGASAAGQLEILRTYDVTAESVGCEIRSSMDTVLMGEVRPGIPVFLDRHALEGADAVIPINRVKPHTDFTGSVESGLMKMISIGLGKQRGAEAFHRQGFGAFDTLIPAVAEFVMARVNVPFGIALIENAMARLWQVEAIPGEILAKEEPRMLGLARSRMPRLPMNAIDVLVIDAIGKDISGLGMDSNVVGRYYSGPLDTGPSIQRIFLRGLTEETAGNAVGIGLADVVLERAVTRMDRHKTYINCITAKTPEGARVPLTVRSDVQGLTAALACCLRVEASAAKIVRISDTKHLDRMWVSEPLLEHLVAEELGDPLSDPEPITFDEAGMFECRL